MVPVIGDVVEVRGEPYRVKSVRSGSLDSVGLVSHVLGLVAISDAHELKLAWELETGARVLSRPREFQIEFSDVEEARAFRLEVKRSRRERIHDPCLLSALYSDFSPYDYQLLPCQRVFDRLQIRLLLADEVGLGKTIQAGLIVKELLIRRRINQVIVLAPAHLQGQWQRELSELFGIPSTILNASELERIGDRTPLANPWNLGGCVISSFDLLKRRGHLGRFLAGSRELRSSSGLKNRDLLIVDEAHKLALAREGREYRETERGQLARAIVPLFDHVLFLTATPHNGYTASFRSLLHLLGGMSTKESLGELAGRLLVRRTRSDLRRLQPHVRLPERRVEQLEVRLSRTEERLFELVDSYFDELRGLETDQVPIQLHMSVLKKRLLSSVHSFAISFERHRNSFVAGVGGSQGDPAQLLLWDDCLPELKVQGSERLSQIALEITKKLKTVRRRGESKLSRLKQFVVELQRMGGGPLLVFTEYLDTQANLAERLSEVVPGIEIQVLNGGQSRSELDRVVRRFNELEFSVLISTDAGAEGLNLQGKCSRLIHWEVPWNPTRMEQRNGRIDRIGQRAEEVWCLHLGYRGRFESDLLHRVVAKIQCMRSDLGAINDVISRQVERSLTGSGSGRVSIPKRLVEASRRDCQIGIEFNYEEVRSKRLECHRRLELGKAWSVTEDKDEELGGSERLKIDIERVNTALKGGRLLIGGKGDELTLSCLVQWRNKLGALIHEYVLDFGDRELPTGLVRLLERTGRLGRVEFEVVESLREELTGFAEVQVVKLREFAERTIGRVRRRKVEEWKRGISDRGVVESQGLLLPEIAREGDSAGSGIGELRFAEGVERIEARYSLDRQIGVSVRPFVVRLEEREAKQLGMLGS